MFPKACRKCNRELPLSAYHRNTARPDGRQNTCKSCVLAAAAARYQRRKQGLPDLPREGAAPAGYKRCPTCELTKATSECSRNRSTGDGLAAYCKPCHNAKGKETYTRLYGSTREYHLRRRYGVTSAQVDEMIDAQFGKCAVCQTAPAEHVDHDHETGAVRGILCFNCNGALGHVRDRPDVLLAAIDYLRAHAPTKEKGRIWRKTLEAPGVYRLSS